MKMHMNYDLKLGNIYLLCTPREWPPNDYSDSLVLVESVHKI